MTDFEKLLDEKGMTAYRLSQITGYDQALFSRLKSGKIHPKNLKFETVYKIAKALGVEMTDVADPSKF